MWLISVGQCELSIEVLLQHWDGFYGLEQSGVNGLLVSLSLVRHNGGLGSVSFEKIVLTLFGGLLLTREVFIGKFGNVDFFDIHGRLGSNYVCLVDSANRHTVDFERSGHEEQSGVQNFQGYNALSTEASGQKNQHSTRRNGITDLRRLKPTCKFERGRVRKWTMEMTIVFYTN